MQSDSSMNDASSSAVAETENKSDAENVVKLTEIVNKILSATGHMDIYEESFESITYKV